MSLHNHVPERKVDLDAAAKAARLPALLEERVKPVRDEAKRLIGRGFSVIPLKPGKKIPIHDDWTNLRIGLPDVERYFRPGLPNIAILPGGPSNGLVDIDLDAPEALVLADDFLPDTDMVHGLPGKPRSHRWYRIEGDLPPTKRFIDPVSKTMLVEFRSTGTQTAVPPAGTPAVSSSSGDVTATRPASAGRIWSGMLRGCRRRLCSAGTGPTRGPARRPPWPVRGVGPTGVGAGGSPALRPGCNEGGRRRRGR
jgi:bifunctional DNA primase/polymerase-like protein